MTPDTATAALTEDIARVVESVPGVAFLSPGLAGRLRSSLARPRENADRARESRNRAPTAGVRLSGPGDGERRYVEIRLVALRQARAVDVARAARRGVETHLAAVFPADGTPVHVTVTVTGQV